MSSTGCSSRLTRCCAKAAFEGRFELAHDEEKDRKKATLEAMEGWADRYNRKPDAVHATKGYLRMLNQFSDSALPLLPDKKMAAVLVEKT